VIAWAGEYKLEKGECLIIRENGDISQCFNAVNAASMLFVQKTVPSKFTIVRKWAMYSSGELPPKSNVFEITYEIVNLEDDITLQFHEALKENQSYAQGTQLTQTISRSANIQIVKLIIYSP
jgi:hypothetical protein